jgi:hypothetical protein|tara:strand:+ start:6550 stop:6843 length:294 start_codon:yes stop_codon:yes gene_type:complete
MDNEFSDFKLERKECEKCGATWINGKHVFRGTGASSENSELDLAGLVCNKYGNEQCINPKKGQEGGQTWEYRAGYIDGVFAEKKKQMEDMRDKFGDL